MSLRDFFQQPRLSDEQKIIYDFFLSILPDTGDPLENKLMGPKFYVLNAPAGTGKTFLINKISSHFNTRKDFHGTGTVMILAPTNKAVSLLPRGSLTIHKFFQSSMQYDEDGGQEFDFQHILLNKSYPLLRLLIVDEASMVSSKMIEAFQTLRLHILFTCDEAQLPPVGEDTSPIFDLDSVKFSLTTNMRSTLSPDNAVVQLARNKVMNPGDKTRFKGAMKEATIDDVISRFSETEEGLKETVVLAYTKICKNDWNTKIRTKLYAADSKESPGVQTCLDKVYIGEKMVFSGHRKCEEMTYYSSDIIEVDDLKEERIRFPEARSKKDEINFFVITDQYGVVWNLPKKPADEKKMNTLLKKKRDIICAEKDPRRRKFQWVEYYSFKNTYNPDLDYTYASTVHKAQGSEWQHVFVDYYNLNFSEKKSGPIFRDRLVYTALSRMRETLHYL